MDRRVRRSGTFAALAVAASALAAIAAPPAGAADGPLVAANAYQAWLVCAMNDVRADAGVAPIQFDPDLSASARAWVRQARHDDVGSDPDLFDDAQRIEPELSGVSENVLSKASGRVGDVHAQLAGSGTSTPNFANASWDRVGVGVTFGEDGSIWASVRLLDGPAHPRSHPPSCVGRAEPPPPGEPYDDVPADSYYAAAVDWLRETGVTTGVAPGRFGPAHTVTRAQIATFLWRLAGQPLGTGEPFTDVGPTTYYAEATRWLRTTGITTGVGGSNRFEPATGVTRAQLVAFLHRYAGRPAAPTAGTFADVPAASFYADAVAWAAHAGVTTGVSPGRFAPDDVVTRAQMAAFLQRFEGARASMAPGAHPIVR